MTLAAARLPDPPLLVITDRRQARMPLQDVAAAVFENGGRWLLFREKSMVQAELLQGLARLTCIAHPFGGNVMVSADVAAALATGAGGVHLPARGDMGGGGIAAARAALGPAALIGYSAHNLAEAEAAQRAGADYVTLSPLFGSLSKPGYGPALGVETLRNVAARLSIPVIALGGVTADNARACLDAGAAGVAVMGEIMRAEDPGATTAKLLEAMKERQARVS